MTAFYQLPDCFAMTYRTRELVNFIAVPLQAEPFQSIQNGVDSFGRRALAVRVFDAQQHLAARMPCVKPVEERRTRAADMQKARRRRGKTRNHLLGFI